MANSKPRPGSTYQPGDWFGIVRNGTVVLLGAETPSGLIDNVWELLASAPEAHEVLHEVTDAFGVSLSRIPPFGIIDSKDALRVFLRGELELTVQLPAGEEIINGRDVTTWTERRLPAAASFSVRIGGGTGSGSTTPVRALPLQEGVVLLAALEVPLAASAASSAASSADRLAGSPVAPAPPVFEEPQLLAEVPDDTMIGYADVDLGLTIAPGQLGLEQPSADEAPADQTPADEAPADQTPADEAPADQTPADEAPADQTPAEVPPAEEFPALEPPAETPTGVHSDESDEVPVHTSTTDPMSHSLENTTNYDHLWDKTVMRNIEDAAIRLDDASDEHDTPAASAPAAAPMPPTAPQPDRAPEPTLPESKGDAPAEGRSGVGQVPGIIGSVPLIEAVPWMRGATSAPTQAAPAQSAPTQSSPATPAPQVVSGWVPGVPAAAPSVAGPAGAPQSAPVPPPTTREGDDSDHDGQTIMKSSLDTPVRQGAASGQVPVVNGPSVLARVCSQGHANPPTYSQCAACGLALSGDAVQVPRPRLGRMRLSTGELIDLDQSLIIGRQPSVSRVQGGTMPRLVQVESPGGDISRSHVEVRLEGWHVMLCDLKATNGTVLIREGQAPRRLAQNEMAILLDGDIAELGDDISLRFEEIL
ncbi:hypothetical protein ACIQC5_06675 [Paenarthrobacter sp. NPDC092416]|uniref:FHA domain-containing protein n=1 Tax=Paenarthrobacter sp. NPDC092416 TaxID=3364386 RepID=UPI00380762B2